MEVKNVGCAAGRKKPADNPPQMVYIQEAVAFIRQNYQRDIAISEVAELFHLDRSYFGRVFKENVGCSPQAFLIRIRLTHAAEEMKTTSDPIGDIAIRCGYPSPVLFSQAFRKHYGMTPREWRKRNKALDTVI